MSETYFINKQYRKNILNIFLTAQLNVNLESYGLKTQDKFDVCAEKLDTQNLVQLRITDLHDQSKMFICTIDNELYENIKLDQSLHVSFQGFVDHLIKILENCKRGELHILLVKENEMCSLQFYEKRVFRNLIHLYLPMQEAPVDTVLFHINQSLLVFQEQISFHTNQNQALKQQLIAKEEAAIELRKEVKKLSAHLAEQENQIFNRNLEEVKKLQNTIKNLSETKETEERRLKNVINDLKEKNEELTKQNYILNEKILGESKTFDEHRNEINQLKLQNNLLQEQNGKLLEDIKSYRTKDRKNELGMIDMRRQLNDLRESINSHEKQKSDLMAELEAEKNLCHTKRNALQMTTDEISKANTIILKQRKEIEQMKKTIEWRTEVALQQETAVKRKEKENSELNRRFSSIEKELQDYCQNSNDLSETMIGLKEATDEIEEKYNKKINELRAKVHHLTGSDRSTVNLPSSSNNINHRFLRNSNRNNR